MMKLHVVTVGRPKLGYAQTGWDEYASRLERLHSFRATQVADKHAYNAKELLKPCGDAYKVALVIKGKQLSSPELATFLEKRALEGREVCFIIGGPEGLPQEVIKACNFAWSLSRLTLPHDLAMVATLEALYRASTINAHLPYHK